MSAMDECAEASRTRYAELLAARYWQEQASQGRCVPFRCKSECCGRLLEADIDTRGGAVLRCPDCGCIMDEIPQIVLLLWRTVVARLRG